MSRHLSAAAVPPGGSPRSAASGGRVPTSHMRPPRLPAPAPAGCGCTAATARRPAPPPAASLPPYITSLPGGGGTEQLPPHPPPCQAAARGRWRGGARPRGPSAPRPGPGQAAVARVALRGLCPGWGARSPGGRLQHLGCVSPLPVPALGGWRRGRPAGRGQGGDKTSGEVVGVSSERPRPLP